MMRPDSGVAKTGGILPLEDVWKLEAGGIFWKSSKIFKNKSSHDPLFERIFFVGILPPQKTKEKENTTQLALINLYFFFVNVSNTTYSMKKTKILLMDEILHHLGWSKPYK